MAALNAREPPRDLKELTRDWLRDTLFLRLMAQAV